MGKFLLGEILKDKVTGFQGVAMARTEYFTDCTHYGLCSQNLESGKPIDWEWFDETRLVKTEEPIVTRELRAGQPTTTSGIYPNAPQN